MSTNEFDFNVPLPTRAPRGRQSRAHFLHRMPVGASKFVAETDIKPSTLMSSARGGSQRAFKTGGQMPRFRVSRVVENDVPGVRVWRTA